MSEEGRDLSASEAVVMKVVWDAGGVISFLELKERLKKDQGKDYSRNSITTFLTRMEEKGFVERQRQGRTCYIRALKDKEEYAFRQLRHNQEMWFSGKVSRILYALIKHKDITKEEIAEIRKMLDESEESSG